MNLYLKSTANLGDFLNSMPVLAGLSMSYGPIDLIIRNEMRKFKGIKEFIKFQSTLFNEVNFDDEIFFSGVTEISSWTREDQNNPNRPIETCRYENWMKDRGFQFEVMDNFEIQVPDLGLSLPTDYLVGDRWNVGDIDTRRETNVLSYLDKYTFLDYNNDLLTNAYIIKNSSKPFITNLTGVAVLGDLLNKEQFIVWKSEDWKPEFRKGENITWDNGKDINKVFAKHFYGDRKSKLIHASDLEKML
jgi:hypothetical protein